MQPMSVEEPTSDFYEQQFLGAHGRSLVEEGPGHAGHVRDEVVHP